jgi:hypothetical protein
LFGWFSPASSATPVSNSRYTVSLGQDGALQVESSEVGSLTFRPEFTVLIARENPKLAMRPGSLPTISHNVLTWEVKGPVGQAALAAVKRTNAEGGDGFDDRILDADTKSRTADLFVAGTRVPVAARAWESVNGEIRYRFNDADEFSLSASVTLPPGDAEPILKFKFTPKTSGYFSVGYTGAPATDFKTTSAIWQPFLWQ